MSFTYQLWVISFADCFHETVQRNYTEILDEIEDDIIKDVISKCPNISTYAKEMCLDVHKTRVESATIFLQLALANDFILEGLRDSLKRLSLAHFIPFRCQICKEGNCMKGKYLNSSQTYL